MDTKDEAPMTPAEVAYLLGIDPKTVSRMADDGRLPSFRTSRPGPDGKPRGHRRFPAAAVRALIESTKTGDW